MPDERHYGGQDAIAGTPRNGAIPPNRKVSSPPEFKEPTKARPRRKRRGG